MEQKTIGGLFLLTLLSLAFIFTLNNRLISITPAFPNTSMTSNITLAINPGVLSVDIVDGSYTTIASPSFAMNPATFAFVCQNTSGIFGTAAKQIYVKNPDAADNGWVVSLAAASPNSSWSSATAIGMDFNDPSSGGCGDGADLDTLKGQMTIDPSVGILTTGACSICTTASVTKAVAPAAFSQGVLDSITILTGAAASDDIGDWKLTGVGITQKIPAEQPAANDYNIDLTLSIIAT